MIVDDFDILGVPHHPPETDAPLVIDSYTRAYLNSTRSRKVGPSGFKLRVEPRCA